MYTRCPRFPHFLLFNINDYFLSLSRIFSQNLIILHATLRYKKNNEINSRESIYAHTANIFLIMLKVGGSCAGNGMPVKPRSGQEEDQGGISRENRDGQAGRSTRARRETRVTWSRIGLGPKVTLGSAAQVLQGSQVDWSRPLLVVVSHPGYW